MRIPIHENRVWRLVTPFAAPLGLLACTLLMCGDVLISPRDDVLGKAGLDLQLLFGYYREFGFGQMRNGHFPLWNPHVFSGAPFFGNFQSALLYPINWIHLLLPLDKAINAEVAIHLYLTGLWMYLWTSHRRRLHPAACFMAAVLWMFGGPYFLKAYAGHLGPLAAMCWIPLVLLAADLLFDRRFAAGALLGVGAVAMQLLAGHPQTVYNTAIAVALYAVPRLIREPRRLQVAGGLIALYLGAVAVAAVQVLAGLAAAAESARAGSEVPKDFVRMFSLPPENFLTAVAPGFFGDLTQLDYWGRAYLWEMSLFMGVTGLALAVYAVAANWRGTRRYWVPLLILLLFALGGYTPLFSLLYEYLPGFTKFRGHSRFIVPAGAFLAMLAATGLDGMIHTPRLSRFMAVGTLAFGGLAGGAGLWLRLSGDPQWARLLAALDATHESYIPRSVFAEESFITFTRQFASGGLLICAGTCLLLCLLWSLRARSHKVAYAMVGLAVLEVFIFARHSRATFSLATTQPRKLQQLLAQRPPGYRILNTELPNSAMMLVISDIWGFDPLVLGRYMSFMAWSQGMDPATTNPADVQFTSYPPLYRMLRWRDLWVTGPEGPRLGKSNTPPLPQLVLLHQYKVLPERDRIFEALIAPGFDPAHTVILESEPNPRPVQGPAAGAARVVESTTDSLTIEAEVPRATILLITDSYSRDWRAVPLDGGTQQRYEVLPANYVLRAIPLQEGRHRLRLEYAPATFQTGKWITCVALVVYVALLGWFGWARMAARAPSKTLNSPNPDQSVDAPL